MGELNLKSGEKLTYFTPNKHKHMSEIGEINQKKGRDYFFFGSFFLSVKIGKISKETM